MEANKSANNAMAQQMNYEVDDSKLFESNTDDYSTDFFKVNLNDDDDDDDMIVGNGLQTSNVQL